MTRSRRYDGYTSFQYLRPGVDYRAFELADEVERVPAWRLPLSDEEEERVRSLSDSLVTVSLHEHLGAFPADIARTPDYVREGRMATAYRGLADCGWDAILDNLMDGICVIHSRSGWKWTEVLHDLGMRLSDLAHQDFLVHCTRAEQIPEAHESGRIAWIASMEGAAMIENELDRIDILHGFGVRALGITYSEANALGSGLKEPRDGGLTAFGRKAVERMNRLGMLIDCSHCGDRTTLDTIEASEHPVVLSHIGARALWDSRRLAPDEVLEACAARGGVIGIEAAPHTTLTRSRRTHGLESFMEHFEYVKALVGIDHVGFGPDTVFGDHVGLHEVYSANLSLDASRGRSGGGGGGEAGEGGAGARARGAEAREAAPSSADADFEKVPWVEGLENPTEASHNILRWLVKHGYDDEEIGKVMGGNALRLLREVWA